MLIKRIINFFVSFCILIVFISVVSCDKTEEAVTIIACSDFQHPDGHNAGAKNVKRIVAALKNNGVSSASALFCCGDYDYKYEHKSDGIDILKKSLSDIAIKDYYFVQGNHDAVVGSFGMCRSGNNDPINGDYAVYVINEDDYMWHNGDEERIKNTSEKLSDYLDIKLHQDYKKPIFVLSHLPLHYSMRTENNGDAMYADYIFEVINRAAADGLEIFFLFGHNHSNGWDDYLGGACVYLKKGDYINIANHSKSDFVTKKLYFTYFNPGYIGYYSNVNGADDALTMSVIKINDDKVEVSRYSENGIHPLKSKGVTNIYKNETAYPPDKKEYTSPDVITVN